MAIHRGVLSSLLRSSAARRPRTIAIADLSGKRRLPPPEAPPLHLRRFISSRSSSLDVLYRSSQSSLVTGTYGSTLSCKSLLGTRCFSSTGSHIVLEMPALSPTMNQGNIAKWRKQEGDKIDVGDVICEIETDKATLEFESLEEGYLAKILAPEGSKDVFVGQPIAVTVEDLEEIKNIPADILKKGEVKEEKSAQVMEHKESNPRTNFSRINPSAKLLITEYGLEASSLKASGPRGTLLKGDVLDAIKSGSGSKQASRLSREKSSASAHSVQSTTHIPPHSGTASPIVDAYEDFPNSQIRKVIAKWLLESKQSTPHLYLSSGVILDPLLAFRKELKDQHNVKVSVNDIVIRAVALALKNVPEANAYRNDEKGEASLCDSIDISIAVATEKGLMTPIIKNADQKRLSAISSEKYMMCTSFVDIDSISLSANLRNLSLKHNNKRSIMTWASVNEQEVIKALENFLFTIEDKTLSTKEMCSMYIERLIRSGNLSDAVYLFSYLHDRQIHLGLDTYNILLNAAAEANSFDLFAEIFKKLLLSRLPPDFTSYVHVAKALRNVSETILILKFIRELSEITIHREPIVMNRIIYIIAKSGQLDKSLMIFEELKNSKARIDTVTFNTVLVMLGRAGRVDEMLYEFNVMKDFGHTPNIVTYNTLINCLRRLGRLDMCNSFAKEMVEKGIELDLRTYTALIDGFGRAGHVNDAMRLFVEMKTSHRPSIYVYRAMISNLKKAGRFELALNLLEEMNSSTLKLIGPEDFKRKKKTKYYWKVRLGGS